MKKIITLTLASALFMPQLFLHAEESHHPKGQGVEDAPVMCEHMQEMMSQMEEIRVTNDPVKRNKLVEAHMQTMKTMHKEMASKKGDIDHQESQPRKSKSGHKDHRKSK